MLKCRATLLSRMRGQHHRPPWTPRSSRRRSWPLPWEMGVLAYWLSRAARLETSSFTSLFCSPSPSPSRLSPFNHLSTFFLAGSVLSPSSPSFPPLFPQLPPLHAPPNHPICPSPSPTLYLTVLLHPRLAANVSRISWGANTAIAPKHMMQTPVLLKNTCCHTHMVNHSIPAQDTRTFQRHKLSA